MTLQSFSLIENWGFATGTIYLLAYNVVAMPLNWWFCRRIGHHRWSWGILIVLAIGFAWYGYRNGVAGQQKNFQVNELTFISHPAGGEAARATSFTTIFTPHRFKSDLKAPTRVFPSRLLVSEREDPPPLTLSFNPSAAVKRVLLHPWTVMNLRSDYTIEQTGGLEVAEPIQLDAGDVKFTQGEFVNKTGYTFRRWWIGRRVSLSGNRSDFGLRVWPGQGPLASGESASLEQLEPSPGYLLWSHLIIHGMHGVFDSKPASIDWQWQSMHSPDSGPLDDGLHFLGEADGSFSPIVSQFSNETYIGRILFEEELPCISTSSIKAWVWDPGHWHCRLSMIGDTPAGLPDDPDNRMKDGVLRFPLNEIIIELIPLLKLEGEAVGALEISFKMTSIPEPDREWETHLPGGTYRMAGCPVAAYNFKEKEWVDMGLWTGEAQVLSPLKDYILLQTSAVILQLNAEPDEVRYRPSQTGPNDAQILRTGKELFEPEFGVQIPYNRQDLIDWVQFRPRHDRGPPVAAQIRDLQITVRPDRN